MEEVMSGLDSPQWEHMEAAMAMESLAEANIGPDSDRKISHKEKLQEKWMETYEKLIQYKEEFGNCNVPRKSKTHKALGEWVHGQRKLQRQDKLPQDRLDLLDAIGFVWMPYTDTWNDMYNELVQYYAEKGNSSVPSKSQTHPTLAKWVERQRKKFHDGLLPEEHVSRLYEVEFVFDPSGTKWNAMYQKLQEFKTKHGHCDVPNRFPEDRPLGRWVTKMRTHCKSEMLSDERLNLLRQIGFEFREEDSDKPESAKSPKSAKSKLKSAKTNEERQIQLLKMCQQALTQTRDENRRLLEENKRKSEEISEQADTINRLKATIRALAS